MKFSILTLFPEMFAGVLENSILRRASAQGLIDVDLIQIRDFALDRHRSVDDYSFGGGPGMVMKADVMERALFSALGAGGGAQEQGVGVVGDDGAAHVVYLSPQGGRFTQKDALRLSRIKHLVLVCGHYEGVDERFVNAYVHEELSIGDFVLTGGEIPAMLVLDAVGRLLPGVLGDSESFRADSFYESLLDHPHYTRPARWVPESGESGEDGTGNVVAPPKELLSGNHQAIKEWRRRSALLRTLIRRPDLLDAAELTRVERKLLQRLVDAMAKELEDTP